MNYDNLKLALNAYQKKKSLSMDEIWDIQTFFKIVLIENIADICKKIMYTQIQKYKAEEIVERLVEKKDKEQKRLKNNISHKYSHFYNGEYKFPYIEHLSYKLKMAGKSGKVFLDILEDEVNKTGTTISEIIQKEHFDVALNKVSMANSITTIKRLGRMNFLDIFENINIVEDILKQDPAEVYSKMDFSSKDIYRSKIQELAKKNKISEIYIAKTILELAKKSSKHIGYYLISDGFSQLIGELGIQKKQKLIKDSIKSKVYVYGIAIITLVTCLLLSIPIYKKVGTFMSILSFIVLGIPVSEIYIQIIQFVLGKVVKPKQLPKMDFSSGIPEENATFVVIPTILSNEEKVIELLEKLEVFYLANKSENLYLALLGDCTSSNKEKEEIDDKIIKIANSKIEELNQKYKTKGFKKFHFLYRKRVWNEREGCYLGWERKRGLLMQFNDYIINNNKSDFIFNTIDITKCPYIKYVITLDSDTDLTLETAFSLVGAMAHPLNEPVVDGGRVVRGHALIQPKVGINIDASRRTLFSKIFAGSGGTDLYTNAMSDVYQDNFNEGIFTGKGIYDLEVFFNVLKNQIPENTVLSHDLLEGSYLRCALASDIMLMDGYPCKYNSFIKRLHRWIRGDWQISAWILKNVRNNENIRIKNPLNFLSKFKIFDNLRRSLLEISFFLCALYSFIVKNTFNYNMKIVIDIAMLSIIIPIIIETIDIILFRKKDEVKTKTFTNNLSGFRAILIRLFLNISFLPHKAYVSADAILRTIYRKHVTKKKLLEWTTSEEAEKEAKTDILSYYKLMFINVIAAIVSTFFIFYTNSIMYKFLFILLSIMWLIAPFIAGIISKEKKKRFSYSELSKDNKEYVNNIGKKTWQYFKDTLIEENNFLPPDNYQESRRNLFVCRTSSTNIGLALLAVISSYDLKYENYDDTISLLTKMLETIDGMQKWNGHLYNWYNIKTLEPLSPRYVSTVDSGNFVGYLYVVRQFLEKECIANKEIIEIVDRLIENTDFTKVYDYKAELFSIGYNVEENKLTNSYYDLLASESRQASLVAIAKGDIKAKHWRNLGRTLTSMNNYKGLISWSGTAFEYLMPNINIPQYEGSLLEESCEFMVKSQIDYCKKIGIPWGISESAFNLKDLHSNYQYKAFGIPWLGLKRGLEDEFVVSSYGSMMWIANEPNLVIKNIKQMEKQGAIGKYGLYESIDYTPSRIAINKSCEVVKTYMAHHQGLILLSINNLINDNVIQKRFIKDPSIKAVDILLQERMPENVVTTKEKKQKPNKNLYVNNDANSQIVLNKPNYDIDKYNVISNENYSIVINQKGEGYSKYNDILINRYKETSDVNQGMFFYIKSINSNRIWTSNYMNYMDEPDKYEVVFGSGMSKIKRCDGNIETTSKITCSVNKPIEIRELILKNNSNQEEILEVTSCFEPIISSMEQDISHPIFNNLFLRYSQEEENLVIERRNRDKNVDKCFLATALFTDANIIGKLEYEINKGKFFGRGNINTPEMVSSSKSFSNSIDPVTEPIVAMKKTIKLEPGKKVRLSLIISISNSYDEAVNNLNEYKNQEIIENNFKLMDIKSSEEMRFMGISQDNINNFYQILSFILNQNITKSKYLSSLPQRNYSQKELWKYGISGDMPIIVVKIRDLNDSFVISDMLKIYEYLRVKNIFTELVILNQEKYSYNSYANEVIENCILNAQLSYLKNIRSGIFIINEKETSKDDLDLLYFRANLIIYSHLGNLKIQLKDIEDEFKKSKKYISIEEPETILLEEETVRGNIFENNEVFEHFKYYNEFGAFSKDGKEYFIKVNKDNNLPTTWSHILANKNFGTLVTEGYGGYTWHNNSRLNRITAWNNNPSQDIPSEIIYLKDTQTSKCWSLGCRPMPDNNDYYIKYGFGYACFEHLSQGISQKLNVFVPMNENVKVNLIELKNTYPTSRKLKLYYYLKPVLGEDEIKSNGFIKVNKESNIVYFKNMYASDFKDNIAYVSCSEKIKSYTGSKDEFIGYKNLSNPEAIFKTNLSNNSGLGSNSCVAIEIEIELKAFEEKTISIILGEDKEILDIKNICYKYNDIVNCRCELEKVKVDWENIIGKLQVQTPVESMNIMLNGWCIYQTLASRLYARTGYYQSGGAFGFRDQLQDTLCLRYINPEIMKNQILKHSMHQFVEGDVEHWWHDDTNKGIRTRFSDDLLWLVYVCLEYIKSTGDESILDVETSYIDGNLLPNGVNEKYDEYIESSVKESIYEHMKKAVNKSLDFGVNGLPKIGSGDWNDGMSEVGSKGIGESVWLGFFIYDILNKFIPIMKKRNDNDYEKYETIEMNLKKSLNKNAWDGRWFKRAFMDNGDILGSIENEECRIDNIAQTWSVISDAADNDKKYISMESMETHLVDKENSIIKLLDPPFDKGKLEPGYIKAYLPGVRENGGQYTHGAVWAIIAEAMLGFGDKAVEFFRILNPIEHSRTREASQKYKVEPYVVAADIYGMGSLVGHGGWTWYTGASSWLYKAGIEYILGLKIENNILKIEPSISREWKEYSIRYKFGNGIYNIKVKNPEGKMTGVKKFIFNGIEIEEKQIKLSKDEKINEIEIIM